MSTNPSLASNGPPPNIHEDLLLRPPLLLQPLQDGKPDNEMICRLFVASRTLRLGMETRFSAVVLWHRYYYATPTSPSNDKAWAAAACLLLACKSEEEPRRLRDIINVCHMYLKDPSTAPPEDSSKEDALVLSVSHYPPRLDEHYWKSKEILVRAEQTVLRWLGFDASVSKPHRAVCLLLQEPKIVEVVLERRQVTYNQLVPVAWRRLNDALFSARALMHPVVVLAAASIELALEEVATDTPKEPSGPWWWMIEVSGAALAAAKKDLQAATEVSGSGGPTNGNS